MGVGYGDEVVTAANTFPSTVGAIAELGAKPVLVDVTNTFCMDVSQIQEVVTKNTKAIVPVHFTGYMTDMSELMGLAENRGIPVVEDACQSILASFHGQNAGTWGTSGAFSLHPLKNLNVWSDGGVIVTNDSEVAKSLRIMRNNGLSDRNNMVALGCNSRLDTIQAVVGNWLLPKTEEITKKRIENAAYYDCHLSSISQLRIPPRPKDYRIVYHLYVVFAERRDDLVEFCKQHGVEAKIHYPKPLYLQPALSHLGYSKGDFPVTDQHARSVITFPCDQHLTQEQLSYVVSVIKEFYEIP